MLRRSLVKQGWTVAEPDNGRAALERMAAHTPWASSGVAVRPVPMAQMGS